MTEAAGTLVAYPALGERTEAVRQAAGKYLVLTAESEADALPLMADAVAFIGRITPALLAAAPRLKWVQCPTASLEHYVFPALVKHSAVLTNAAGLFGDVIAEHVLGLILSFTRNLHLYRDQQNRGEWSKVGGGDELPDFFTGPADVTAVDRAHRRLSDQRILIVGFGSIGAALGERLLSLGCHVEAVDPAATNEQVTVHRPDRLDDRLPRADFVVVAAPETPHTRGMFNADRLGRMNRQSVLINVGRGSLVETVALTEAIVSGGIAGAALDVVDPEPLPADHPLLAAPNVLITPHVAAANPIIAKRHLELITDNVRRFVSGVPLRNVVDLADWRTSGSLLRQNTST